MEKVQYRKNAYKMIYLTICSLRGTVPKKEKLQDIDYESLLYVCEEHSLSSAVGYALESAGVKNYDFIQAKEKAVRKEILLDMWRNKVTAELEKKGIWYMTLKGALLKSHYPKTGMRQMSDNDILFDPDFREEVKDIMLGLDFVCDHYGKGAVDTYFKEPVCNFEMHIDLYSEILSDNIYNYYRNVKDRLLKDDGNNYGWHFSDEDFYIYMIVHEYKHFFHGGTGVRSLADTYVYIKKFGNSMDWDYINEQLRILGTADFESKNRELAMAIFSGKKTTPEQRKLLDFYIFSGTYGTVNNEINTKIKNHGSTFKYIMFRIFPPVSYYKFSCPTAYKHKWLLPFAWLYRLPRGIINHSDKIYYELKVLLK